VPAEERDRVRRSAALVDGDDGKGAPAAGLPVDGDVLGICLGSVSAALPRSRAVADLDQVGVPGVLGDAEVIVALLLLPF
jgi:hypothetical protein